MYVIYTMYINDKMCTLYILYILNILYIIYMWYILYKLCILYIIYVGRSESNASNLFPRKLQ